MNNDFYSGSALGGAAPNDLSVWLASLWPLVIFLLCVGVVWLPLLWWRKKKQAEQYLQHVIFQIKVPKAERTDADKRSPKEYFHSEVARSETIIEAIGGLQPQHGWSAWLNGRTDTFSLEVVAFQGAINFYLAAPSERADFIEKQINAHFPEASVKRAKDYNIFGQRHFTAGAFLMTARPFMLPIKTYGKEEVDSLNSVLNSMSRLEADDAMAVQFVIRSAAAGWHRQASAVVRRAYKFGSLRQALRHQGVTAVLSFIGENVFASKKSLDPTQVKQLTPMEQETIKAIEEKNSKAGVEVNLRLIVSSSSPENAEKYLSDITASFAQYNYFEYGNGFGATAGRWHQDRLVRDFIHRRFNTSQSFVLNTEEMSSLYHFPLASAGVTGLAWLPARSAAAPVELPAEGLILGYNEYREDSRPVRLKAADRLRHVYIIGKSGVGKSILLANMAIQDAANGDGFCLLDPHGDLTDDVLQRLPEARRGDVIVFAPADSQRPLGLNLLEYDSRYPEQKIFVINEMIGIFDKLYDLKTTGGPIFEQYMRNAMLLVMSDPASGSTLLEVPRVLADAEFRQLKLSKCGDPTVVNFWLEEAEKAGGDAALANIVPYITSKLTTFISNDLMRPIIGQEKSSFNLRDIMDEKKILLVSLPKGVVGELNAYLLGMILVGKILMAALSRADTPAVSRAPFYLYIDEFQNFTTDSITQVLSEARKYGLGLTLAHQYIGQLVKKGDTAIKDAVFGNVGTMAAFKVGPEDADFLEKIFKPDFQATDLVNVDKYTAFVRLLIDNANARPFTMKTPWPLFGNPNPDLAQAIKTDSRLKYGTDRQLIEAGIRQKLFN